MENNLLSLNRVFLNITNPADRRGLVINKGDILRGVVQEVDTNGLVRVLIQGRLIEAIAEAQVNNGQNLNLLVEEVRPGRITLKVLTPEAINRLEQANLASQLKELGLIPSEENIRLARTLLENQLPVNRATMGQAVQLLQHLGGSTPETTRLAALVVRHNIPVSPELLERLMSFFNSKPDLANLYQQLSRILVRVQSMPEPALRFSPTPVGGSIAVTTQPDARAVATPPDVRAAGSLSTVDPSASSRILSSQVSADVSLFKGTTTAGINQPENSASGTANRLGPGAFTSNFQPAVGETANQIPASSSSLPAANTVVISKLWTLVQALLENMMVGGDATAKPIQTQLQQLMLSRPDLLQGLLLTESVLETTVPENHPLRELMTIIKSLEYELSGQQMVNTLSRFAPDNNFPMLYLTFPFQIDHNQYTMCELRLHRDRHPQTSQEKDSLRIAVSLDTPQMGIVLFHVAWKRVGILDIQAVVEKEAVRIFLQNHWSELSTSLEQRGYRVNNLGIKVAGVRNEAEPLRPALPSASVSNISPISIDITI